MTKGQKEKSSEKLEEFERLEQIERQKVILRQKRKEMRQSGKSVFNLAQIIKKGAYERHEGDAKGRKNP